jgi:hypothetical protein
VQVWGFTDKHSWFTLGNALLFDKDYKMKLSYAAVGQALSLPKPRGGPPLGVAKHTLVLAEGGSFYETFFDLIWAMVFFLTPFIGTCLSDCSARRAIRWRRNVMAGLMVACSIEVMVWVWVVSHGG